MGSTVAPAVEAGGTKVVFARARANGEDLRATFSEFKGKQYAGVRSFYHTDGGRYLPGKNGISVEVKELPNLIHAALCLLVTARPDLQKDAAALVDKLNV